MKSDLHLGRILFLLVLLPGGLIYFAWRLSDFAANEKTRAEALAAEPTPAEAAEIRKQRALEALEGLFDERRGLARQCVDQAMRSVDGLDRDAAVLVILSGPQCRGDCDSERMATELAGSYYLEGVRVLLIRTSTSAPSQPPPGVYAVVMPTCHSLISEFGDDYFFRQRDGSISSSGTRNEGLMRITTERLALLEPGTRPDPREDPPTLPFNPEAVVRQALDLPPK